MRATNSLEMAPVSVSPSIELTSHSAVKPVMTVTTRRRAKEALMLSLGSCSSAERVLADELEALLEEPAQREGSEGRLGIRKTPPSVGG